METRAFSTWLHEFEHGASFHGNWPACVEAERVLVRFTGGQPCPRDCGTIVRYRVGRPREESVDGHLEDPRRCRRHPKNKKGRRRARASLSAPQVP